MSRSKARLSDFQTSMGKVSSMIVTEAVFWSGRMARLALCAVAAVFAMFVCVSAAEAGPPPPGSVPGIESFETEVLNSAGEEETRASAHPYSARASFATKTYDSGTSVGLRPISDPRTIITELPPGFSGDPTAAGRCPIIDVRRGPFNPMFCPDDSMVGYLHMDGAVPLSVPIINVIPQRGYPASFGFSEAGLTFALDPELRSDSDFGLNVVVAYANQNAIRSVDAYFCSWGVEANLVTMAGDSTFRCREQGEEGAFEKPFLTNPANECTDVAPVTRLGMDSYEFPGVFDWAEAVSPKVTDCDRLTFEPSAVVQPTTSAPDSPTGLSVDLTFPQEDNAEGLAPPALKKAVVTLPEGMGINPPAADGLAACEDADLRLKSKAPMTCPEASKIASVVATTPLLNEKISGSMYIRSQASDDPASGEMYRLGLVLQNAERGIDVRLPGQVRVNPQTGRVETVFDNNPELPVSNIKLDLKTGPRAPLAMPAKCGTHQIETELTSWGGQTVKRATSFNVDCTPGLGGFSPGFVAGTTNPIGGADSSFAMRLSRPDGQQDLRKLGNIKLPAGLLGRIRNVDLCPDAAADQGACGAGSKVGEVHVAAGAGSNPLWVPLAGRPAAEVFLTGPYRGAPYGLSISVAAQAGPFDLGKVVVRSALHVDERTAQITTGVDQSRLYGRDGQLDQVLERDLPQLLKGVILRQREIRVRVDRDQFIINPTNCDEQQITANLVGYGGGQATVGSRFKVGNCADLGFAPRFRAQILDKGRKSTLRSWHPRTRFTVVPRPGDANIGGARVALPSSTILDQGNIGTTCTRDQMAARKCPARSVVGYAKAWSPLLRKAVQGPVYLAANGGVRPLPDLAAVLDGEVRIVLQGEISTLRTGDKARLQNTFRVVPDAPVSRFILTMRGGKNRGLLVNSTDLCRSKERGVAAFTGQNGRAHRSNLRIGLRFKGCRKVLRRQAMRRKAARKKARQSSGQIARKAAMRQAARKAN